VGYPNISRDQGVVKEEHKKARQLCVPTNKHKKTDDTVNNPDYKGN